MRGDLRRIIPNLGITVVTLFLFFGLTYDDGKINENESIYVPSTLHSSSNGLVHNSHFSRAFFPDFVTFMSTKNCMNKTTIRLCTFYGSCLSALRLTVHFR